MAVTPNPCESTNPQVVERVEVHRNLAAKTPLQMRSDGVTKRKRVGGGSETADQTESFSDIDSSEVAGYRNRKEERHYKEIIREKINQLLLVKYANRKKETESKKDKTDKGTAQTTKIDKRLFQGLHFDDNGLSGSSTATPAAHIPVPTTRPTQSPEIMALRLRVDSARATLFHLKTSIEELQVAASLIEKSLADDLLTLSNLETASDARITSLENNIS